MFGLGTQELLIVGTVAVLLFGKRLPEVGRSLGKGIVEFKKGLRGIEDEVEMASTNNNRKVSSYTSDEDYRESSTAPKFEPPAAPQVESTSETRNS